MYLYYVFDIIMPT